MPHHGMEARGKIPMSDNPNEPSVTLPRDSMVDGLLADVGMPAIARPRRAGSAVVIRRTEIGGLPPGCVYEFQHGPAASYRVIRPVLLGALNKDPERWKLFADHPTFLDLEITDMHWRSVCDPPEESARAWEQVNSRFSLALQAVERASGASPDVLEPLQRLRDELVGLVRLIISHEGRPLVAGKPAPTNALVPAADPRRRERRFRALLEERDLLAEQLKASPSDDKRKRLEWLDQVLEATSELHFSE